MHLLNGRVWFMNIKIKISFLRLIDQFEKCAVFSQIASYSYIIIYEYAYAANSSNKEMGNKHTNNIAGSGVSFQPYQALFAFERVLAGF